MNIILLTTTTRQNYTYVQNCNRSIPSIYSQTIVNSFEIERVLPRAIDITEIPSQMQMYYIMQMYYANNKLILNSKFCLICLWQK